MGILSQIFPTFLVLSLELAVILVSIFQVSQHLSDAQTLPQQGLKQPAVNGHSNAPTGQSLCSVHGAGVVFGHGAGAGDRVGDRGRVARGAGAGGGRMWPKSGSIPFIILPGRVRDIDCQHAQ